MSQTLLGRVGIVTGGASGIGLEISKTLVASGAIVYAIGMSALENELPENIHFIQGDVTDSSAMKTIIDEIGTTQGLDFLINNAGITIKKRAEEITEAEFDRIHRVNVYSVFNLSCLAYPYLKQSEHIGRILNISSMAAHMGFSEVVPYCSSKAAVLGITRGLAVEWREDNMLVNSIAPGWFPSEMTRGVMDQKRHESIMNQIGLARFGDPADIGKMARFLLSDDATYLTGQDFAVDGGALTYGY